MSSIDIFQGEAPSLESYWRSIILFGVNSASYKFALAQSVMNVAKNGSSMISLDDLALPYASHLCNHLKKSPKQITGRTGPFIKACVDFNNHTIGADELRIATLRHGFNCVLDAFHVVNREQIVVDFFQKDFHGTRKNIILTDAIHQLAVTDTFCNLQHETEARWRLVETAWEHGLNANLLGVKYDQNENLLFVDNYLQRKNITSARDALNGYQKGKCFYCFRDIDVDQHSVNACDVDHFYPHVLKPYINGANLDGIWNLVLSCKNCNRGADGKFAKVPSTKYVKRLHKRNEFLISSHHPLRETLMQQTGTTERQRIGFMKNIDTQAASYLIHRWEVQNVNPEIF
ncbi:MAG: hypothetical protein IKV92_05985 [Akkermansia sp.]|nr:hypothetical protein [Akkermansia sp.]